MGWSEDDDDQDAVEEVYCICRTSDSDRFMIGCDHCEEWYHGDCINVTERDARKIKRFFCDLCRKKNPGLKIKYKEKHKSQKEGEKETKQEEKSEKHEKAEKPHKRDKHERDEKRDKGDKDESPRKQEKPHKSDKPDKHGTIEKPSKREKESKSVKVEKSEKVEPNEKTQRVDKSEKRDRPEKEDKSGKQEKSEKRNKSEKHEKLDKKEKSEKHVKSEKQKKKTKHDKTDKAEKVEKLKTEKEKEPNQGRQEKLSKEEKPHKREKRDKPDNEEDEHPAKQAKKKSVKAEKVERSDEVSIKREKEEKIEEPAKLAKPKRNEDLKRRESSDIEDKMDIDDNSRPVDSETDEPDGEIYKQRHKDKKGSKFERPSRPPENTQKRRRSTSEDNDPVDEDRSRCGRCISCLSGEGPCKKRPSLAPLSPQMPPVSEPPPPDPAVLRESNRLLSPTSPEEPVPLYRPVRRRSTAGRRRRTRTSSDADMLSIEQEQSLITRQCCGPQCVNACRPGSRYCSDECGLNLARNRIFQVLPQRIQEWNMTRCVAEDTNMRTLEKIRRQQQTAQAQLEKLQRAHAELDRLVERGRRATVDPDALEEDVDEEQHSIHCVTCGHEVLTRNAVRHMEKCFAKYESQTSFGSLYQTRVEGFNMFCDFYNRTQRTYCKRLRVLCPEHWRPPPVGDDEVCGCPLVSDVFQSTGRFCRAPQKRCRRHPAWERLRRAELDMERVRWAMRMDELLEQERQCRQSMAQRAGVLALLLHSTYDHEVMEKVAHQQKKMAANKMRSRPG